MKTATLNPQKSPETPEISEFTADYGNNIPEAQDYDIPELTDEERQLQYNEYVSRLLLEVFQNLSFDEVKEWFEAVSKNSSLAGPFGEGKVF